MTRIFVIVSIVLLSVFSSKSLNAGENIPELENDRLTEEIECWIGTPYRMGRSSKKGTDCSGFVRSIYSDVYGIELVRSSADMVHHISKKIKKTQKLEEGDLVFFKINGRRVSHVGIYLRDGMFVHATTLSGVIVSHLDEAYYKKRFYCGGRM